MVGARFFLAAAVLVLAAPAEAADAFSSDWAVGLKSSARLIGGDPTSGGFLAGVEIKLSSGAITYWRDPGDSGAPPVFSFDGSLNLADARALFPAPRRLNEGDGEAYGYDHSVVLPIEVKPVDPAKPVALSLNLGYAVCEKICVPAKASLHLVLHPGASSPYAEAILEAKAKVPRPVEWSSLAGDAELAAVGEKSWRLCLAPKGGPERDLFVEGPPRWWFAVTREGAPQSGRSCFAIKLVEKPDGAQLPVNARLTVTGAAGAFETTAALGP